MIKHFTALNFLIIPVLALNANISGRDSLVSYNDISFYTKFEEQALCRYFNAGAPEYIRLFLSASEEIDSAEIEEYVTTFNSFCETFNTKKFLKSKPKKKIKTIYRAVHGTFFRKYEMLTSFDKIFKDGDYNCVTASALYGIILIRLNIPFFVVETPVHVYIVSYPDKNRIKIESTGPYAGYFIYSQSLKKAFIENFREYKLIDDKEYSKLSLDELFDKYYFIGNKISIKELIGIQYFNIAAYYTLKNNLEQGYNSLEKAYVFYPLEGTRILLFDYLSNMVMRLTYDNLQQLDYLIKLTKFSNQPLIKELISSEFIKITENFLVNSGNPEYYDSVYNYLAGELKVDEYLKEIEFIYNYEKGRFLVSNGFIVESHNLLLRALELKPGNEFILATFIQSMKGLTEQMDTPEAIERLEKYGVRCPELLTATGYIKVMMGSYLKAASQSFKAKNISKGDSYLNKFEDLCKSDTETGSEDILIGEAYSAASVYYYKKGLYTKAKEYLVRGLNYAPDNKSLRIGISSF